jgi:hypothetical protein
MVYPEQFKETSDQIIAHPFVGYLQGVISGQVLEIEKLKSEIRLLKGHSAKPKIPPNSNLEGPSSKSNKGIKKNSL